MQPRPPRIVILVGLPGSGKSTYLEELDSEANPVSSDDIRRQLADDPTDQTIHSRVFATVRYLLRHRIAIGRPVTYIDATNLTRKERKQYLKIASQHGCVAEAIFFDVPLETCLERNRKRARIVPEEAMRKMSLKLERPEESEGFARIRIVR